MISLQGMAVNILLKIFKKLNKLAQKIIKKKLNSW